MNHLETVNLKLFKTFEIIKYKRYVDDCLLITKQTNCNENEIEQCFNTWHSNIKFKISSEINNKINFLDISIIKEKDKFSTEWYRKPVYTGKFINYNSNH